MEALKIAGLVILIASALYGVMFFFVNVVLFPARKERSDV